EIPDNAFREASRISSTWGGNLVDMVRATRILRTIENENLFAHSRRMGALLLAELNSLVADFPELLQHPRARGLMGAISFRRPEHRDQAIAVARGRHRTLFLPSGPDSLRFRPPL